MPRPLACNRPGCPNLARTSGMCISHYGLRAKAGLTKRVPVAPVAERIRELGRRGWTYRDIRTAAGVSEDTVFRIVGTGRRRKNQPTRTVLRATADRIFRLPLTERDTARMPAVGTVRRMRAMARQGWSLRWQAEQCGLYENTLRHINWRGSQTVSGRVHHAVAELYDRVGLDIGPDERGARWAKDKDWAPPLAWDDDMDDPHARPTRVRKDTPGG